MKSRIVSGSIELFKGSALAQIFMLFLAPALPFVYSAEQLGEYQILLSLCTVLSSLATGRYELASVIPSNDSEAEKVTKLSIFVCFIFSCLLLTIALLFNNLISSYFEEFTNLGLYVYFIPFTVFFIGFNNALVNANIRKGQYEIIAKSVVRKAITLALVQFVFAFFFNNSIWLIIGFLASSMSGNIVLITGLENKRIKSFYWDNDKYRLARRYKKFPLFSLPGAFLNQWAYDFLSLSIGAIFGLRLLGLYSTAFRVMSIPSSVVQGTLGRVYFGEASRARQSKGNSALVFSQTSKLLLLISTITFAFIYFLAGPAVRTMYDESWLELVLISKILIPFFFTSLIVSTLSITCDIYEKNKTSLIWQLIIFVVSYITVKLMNYVPLELNEGLSLFSWLMSLSSIVFFFVLNRISKG